MISLRQELTQLKKENKRWEILDIIATMEDTRDRAADVMWKHQDTGVSFIKDIWKIKQINDNIRLAKDFL